MTPTATDPDIVEVPDPGPGGTTKTDRPPWRADDPYTLEDLEACRDTIQIIRGVLRGWPAPKPILWYKVQDWTTNQIKRELSMVSTRLHLASLLMHPAADIPPG